MVETCIWMKTRWFIELMLCPGSELNFGFKSFFVCVFSFQALFAYGFGPPWVLVVDLFTYKNMLHGFAINWCLSSLCRKRNLFWKGMGLILQESLCLRLNIISYLFIQVQVSKPEKIMFHEIEDISEAHIVTCKTSKTLPKRDKADALGRLLRQKVSRMLKNLPWEIFSFLIF